MLDKVHFGFIKWVNETMAFKEFAVNPLPQPPLLLLLLLFVICTLELLWQWIGCMDGKNILIKYFQFILFLNILTFASYSIQVSLFKLLVENIFKIDLIILMWDVDKKILKEARFVDCTDLDLY